MPGSSHRSLPSGGGGWTASCSAPLTPERRNQVRKRIGLSPGDVAVMWAGRTVFEKRPDIYGDVIRRLRAEGFPAKGVVAGGVGPGVCYCEGPLFHHLGWLDSKGLSEVYGACEMCCSSRRRWKRLAM